MDWWIILVIIFGAIIFALSLGMPIAFGFGIVNLVIAYFLLGPHTLNLIAFSAFSSLNIFSYVAVPLFVLMGEVVLRTGLSSMIFDTMDAVLGRMPGRLAVLSALGGTMFGAVSGSSMASVATVGSVMLPTMKEKQYSEGLATGSILSVGPLAILIPPSALMVIYGGLSRISVADLLIGGVLPGIMIGLMIAAYIVIICALKPKLGPPYAVIAASLVRRLWVIVKNVVPLGIIVFCVVGTIYIGVATPSEAAAAGALGTIVLAGLYRKLSVSNMRLALLETATITGATLIILTGSIAFSQILALTGVARELTSFVVSLNVAPLGIVVACVVLVLFLGCFIDSISIMFITIPIFIPVIKELGFDLVWFAIAMMVAIEIGVISPPFGPNIFTLKAVAPETSVTRMYRAVMPFIVIHLIGLAVVMAVPSLATYLPSLMRR
jgi:tripartite ATP-independent transporter DctM subunit